MYHRRPPRCQLEADDVGSILLVSLHREMRHRPVEHCHSAKMSARRVCRNDAITIRPVGAHAVSDFCFLEDAHVHVGLGHPPKCQLQSPVTTVTDIIGAKHNWHRPPRKTHSTTTNPLPTDAFLTPAPTDLPVRACLPFCRSRPRSTPTVLPMTFMSPLPSPFSPLSYSVPFTSA